MIRLVVVCLPAFVLSMAVAFRQPAIVIGKFEDRDDLSELVAEMLPHEASQTQQVTEISISFRFRDLELASQACDSVSELSVRVSWDGLNARCTVSIRDHPSLSTLEQLREASKSVSNHEGAHSDGWSITREVAQDRALSESK